MIVSGDVSERTSVPAREVRCPKCGARGSFEAIGGNDVAIGDFLASHRQCPRNDCNCYVLVIMERTDDGDLDVADAYPPERLKFDGSNVPPPINNSMLEAIRCHSHGNYIAAAIVVRKVLEEICHDQGATDGTLKDRIEALGENVMIPRELLEGMDDLRLLGNDAAHIEDWTFEEIGEEEVRVAINFTKKIIETTYQFEALLEELKELKGQDG